MLALLASAVGVMVAVDQLTQRGRMRRVAEWSRALAKDEPEPTRRAILADVDAWATGQVVASVLVPARFFLESAALIAVTGWAVIRRENPPALDWDTAQSLLTDALVLWLPVRRATRLYQERCRIASEYFRRADVRPPRLGIVDLTEGGTRSATWWSALIALGVAAAILGGAALFRDAQGGLSAVLLICGLVLAWSGIAAVRARAPMLLGVMITQRARAVRRA